MDEPPQKLVIAPKPLPVGSKSHNKNSEQPHDGESRDWEAAQWGAPIKKEREQPLPAQEHFYGVCGAVWGSTAWRWVYPRQLKHSEQGHFPATPEVCMARSHLAHRVSGSCAGAPFVGSEKKKKKDDCGPKETNFKIQMGLNGF